ncbi:(3,5-dihydroxyphenyl)acetyl-CoA 1,2-dioxygenase DpgC [Kutzneria sp. CA-103260]|uniref:(3,5-dihydroxyphenyl)acetyl-CoA 1,2-dioxygenase DpgC n=1 Tax=Kutzneria sp. CA-103260 TaxID=2802641 RepID=UPI001BED8717|nr:(3,5-dihydroxyphenyl)acetyl-CoA 1,2-dioxygenase DpgC [Kutzneria sp. CA-103260]QUQ65305.1 (3,5-dihydroxyphenyl)acetyl-CoA 1,2-dioxygenase [Kutzneria sp. CA-103260]
MPGLMTHRAEVDRWLAAEPRLAHSSQTDRVALRTYTAQGEALLAMLPDRPERTAEQQDIAKLIHQSCRRFRDRYLSAHVTEVFHEVRDTLRSGPRLANLSFAAAEAFPGLTPTRDQLAEEQARIQADKEGREIDQAILFRRLLRTAATGPHLVESMLRPTERALGLADEFRRTGDIRLDAVHLRRQGPVAQLTIHNEHCLNAEDNRHVADMETAVDLALLDDKTLVGVVRGGVMQHPRYAGRRVFSAGINLKHLHAGQISFTDFLLGRELGYLNKIRCGLRTDEDRYWPQTTVQKPWVAAVDTFAIGGGAQLLLLFDRVIAESGAYFSLPAAQEGIVPGAANLRLGRLTGSRIARQIVLSGRKIWATEPVAGLLFDVVVDATAMDGRIAAETAAMASPAVAANRRMLNLADESVDEFRSYLSEFALQQALRAYAPDVLSKVDRFSAGAQ